jgi:isochorismate hydrolase
MSLVVSSWLVLGNTYQQRLLQLGQLQAQKERIKKELDQHEVALLITVQPQNVSQQSRKSLNESVGMSRRSRPIPSLSRATHKK